MAETATETPKQSQSTMEKVDNFVYGTINKIIDGIKNAVSGVIESGKNFISKLLDNLENSALSSPASAIKTEEPQETKPAETDVQPAQPLPASTLPASNPNMKVDTVSLKKNAAKSISTESPNQSQPEEKNTATNTASTSDEKPKQKNKESSPITVLEHIAKYKTDEEFKENAPELFKQVQKFIIEHNGNPESDVIDQLKKIILAGQQIQKAA
jgi:hypothetical protein